MDFACTILAINEHLDETTGVVATHMTIKTGVYNEQDPNDSCYISLRLIGGKPAGAALGKPITVTIDGLGDAA